MALTILTLISENKRLSDRDQQRLVRSN